MSWQEQITQQVANLTTAYNNLVNQARKIWELPWQTVLKPASKIHVSNEENSSEFITVQQILDAAISFRQNQLIEATVSVDGNDVTVDSGAEWIINNVNHETTSDFEETVPYAETGYTRNDILVGNEANVIYRIAGPETEGISPTPNVPINTVLITTINVTDSTIGYTPPIIEDFEVKINKQNSLTPDGTGNKYPTVDAVNGGLDLKLNIADYNDRFLGVYPTEAALISAHPTANAGDYAQVNEVGSTDVVNYNWDAEENIWVQGGSGGGAVNTDALPEGSSNLYFTTARVLATLLTGISFATGGAIVSTDSVLIAFGKIQKNITDILSAMMDLTTAQTVSGVKTFLNAMLGLRNVANTFTSFFTNTNTASRTYTLQDRNGILADDMDLIPQITITTAVSITTATTAANGLVQKGRNVIISNGATAINLTVNGGTDFVSSYVKHGTGAITFVQGSGRTLVQVDGTNVMNGSVGSTATISSVGTTDYLRISNA